MQSDYDRESLGRVALGTLAIIAYVALVAGCGGSALDRARSTVAGTAAAVAAADATAADIITQRMDAAETAEELEAVNARATKVTRAFTSVHASLLAADSALDAWAAGSAEEGTWLQAVACALPSLLALADILEEFGAPEAVVYGIRAAVGGLSVFVGGECPARAP